jgi:hypothetical protein
MPATVYLRGNVLDGSPHVFDDNRLGTGFEKDAFASEPYEAPAVETQSAQAGYELVLKQGGAIVPKRDATDTRILAQVRNGTGKILHYEKDLGGWPTYNGGTAPLDSDEDGIPDEWEKAQGLDSNDPSDANRIRADGYTNLKLYLNSLVPAHSR